MSNKTRVAIIGCGYWGKNLVRNFYELGALKTVCDLNRACLEELKARYPQILITDSADDIFIDKNIEGVVIATPTTTHYQITKQALLNNKDVFVEKPLALKVKEGKELVNLAEKKNKILMVGHLLLYHPAIVKLEEIIRNGDLGEVRYIYSNRLNFGKLRREENVLWSFAPHDISVILDLMKNVLGTLRKVNVMAVGKAFLNNKIPDITLNFLEFANGKATHIFVSWLNPFKEQKFCVIGSRAMAIFNDIAQDKLIIYKHKVEKNQNGELEAKKVEAEVIRISETEPLKEEARHFLECIRDRKIPRTDGREGLEVLKILDACQKSMDKSGKLIKLKLRDY